MKKITLVSALVLAGIASAQAEDAMDRSDVLARIKPVGTVNVQGMSVTAAAAPAPVAETVAAVTPAQAAPAAAPAAANGKSTYKTACFVCHDAGVAGAPKLGDKAAWATRITQDRAVILEHALKGLNGMPPKGGRADLSDEVVTAAVDYMLSEVK